MRRKPILASEIVRYAVLNIYMDKSSKSKYENETNRLVEDSTKAELERFVNEEFDYWYDVYIERD